MRTIVCYGDSNTHGANPFDQARYPREVRWPGVLRAELGPDWDVIEEGLNGRTTVWDSPFSVGRDGRPYLQPCLWSHAPVDLVIIALGTNDLKASLRNTAADVANGAAALVDLARRSLAGPADVPPRVLVVCPPPLGERTTKNELWGFGSSQAESLRLAHFFGVMALSQDVDLLDAGEVIVTSPADGVHFDADAHRELGRAVAAKVRLVFGADPG